MPLWPQCWAMPFSANPVAAAVLGALRGRRHAGNLLWQARGPDPCRWNKARGALWIGVALGLGAALGQAIGSVIARPLMAGGLDPFVASMVRIGVAGLCLSGFLLLPIPTIKQRNPLTAHVRIAHGRQRRSRHGRRHDVAALCFLWRQDRHCLDPFRHLAGNGAATVVDHHKTKARRGRMARGGPCDLRHGPALCRALTCASGAELDVLRIVGAFRHHRCLEHGTEDLDFKFGAQSCVLRFHHGESQ